MAEKEQHKFNGSQPAGNIESEYIIPLQINGEEVATAATYKVLNPATNQFAWQSSSASKADAVKAAEAAQAAFRAWSQTKASARRDILLKAADVLTKRADEVAGYVRVETGSVDRVVESNVHRSIEQLLDVAGRIPTVVGHVPMSGQDGRSAMVVKEPYGIVLGIAPWNMPLYLGFRAIISAIATGNTVILKGSELSPRVFWAIGSILKEAGLPNGVLNVITHRPEDAAEVTNALIEHPAVKKINFTGSTHVGSLIAAAAGKNLKPVLMELGGKASAIVLKDADLELAAMQCALGAFIHSGQICMATERILIHSSIATPFSSALKSAIATLFPKTGPAAILITPASVKKNNLLISQAISRGASVLTGEVEAEEAEDSSGGGTRMRPVVLENVRRDMDLYYQESFGPSVSLLVVESEEEAVEIANDTEYGLSASVFTKDLATGLRVARQIETGAVHINFMTVHDEANLPHGGAKRSGYGRFNGNAGLEEFLRLKSITWAD